ncbi:hypothetical protein DFH29DRAFT_981666 [Suillus ampliporus]|nr:hypothetical protein DFH29DRAFT_981666 [Suillus ampliporus]
MMYLPDTMTNWPWPRAINPHLEDVKAEVDASFPFDKCDFEHLRIGCDLSNVYFIVDEYTDIENAAVTKEMMDIVLDAIHNPHKVRLEGKCILGEIAFSSRYWARTIQTTSMPSYRPFIEPFTAYVRVVVVEALDREQGHCRSIDDYLKLRRDTCAVKSSVPICETGMEFPDEVFYHPVIVELVDCIKNIQQATGDDAIMLELSLNKRVQKRIIDVRSWRPSVDVPVKKYLNVIAMWT